LIVGSFLLMDGKGSRELAAKYFREAQAGGVDTKFLLPELDLAPATPIEIPEMTPAMRRMLAPAGWTLLTADGQRVKREPLKTAGKVDEAGRLELTLPDDAGPTRVAFSRRIAADFGVRIVLLDVTAGQKFGLISTTNPTESYTVELPAGTVKVEMARKGGKFQCLVNGVEKEVLLPPEANARAAGLLGLDLGAGQSCTIAWFELAGR
jgi:hypothetical protein